MNEKRGSAGFNALLSVISRTAQFLVYHTVVRVVDRVSRLPRGGVRPEVERILRENLALKAQVFALSLELKSAARRMRMSWSP